VSYLTAKCETCCWTTLLSQVRDKFTSTICVTQGAPQYSTENEMRIQINCLRYYRY